MTSRLVHIRWIIPEARQHLWPVIFTGVNIRFCRLLPPSVKRRPVYEGITTRKKEKKLLHFETSRNFGIKLR